jgi:hypothetical protein
VDQNRNEFLPKSLTKISVIYKSIRKKYGTNNHGHKYSTENPDSRPELGMQENF